MARKLQVEIVGDSRSLERALGRSQSATSKFGGVFGGVAKSVAKAAALTGAAVGTGLAAAFKVGLDEFMEAEKVAAQTNAALASTGGIANVTAKEISSLAGAISRKSGIDDEAIQSGQNLLLTFTNVRNEVGAGNDIFNQATRATVDLSVAMGKDMASSALLVGKALNDPVKGATALTRAGVQLSDSQKQLIKDMVATGDVAAAQKVILGELTTQFGGSAEAAGNTFSGALNKLKNAFEEAAGGAVGALVPGLQKVAEGMTGFITKFSEAEGASAKFKVVTEAVTSLAGSAWQAVSDLVSRIDWEKVVTTVREGIFDTIEKVGGFISDALGKVNWGEVGRVIGDNFVKAFSGLARLISQVDWASVGRAVVQGVKSFLAGIDWGAVFAATIRLLVAVVKGIGSLLLGLGSEVGGELLEGMKRGLRAAWPIVSEFVMSIPGRIGQWFANAGQWLYGAGLAILEGLWSGLKAKWEQVSGWFGSLGGKIKDLKGPEDKDRQLLVAEGQAIIEGLQAGMQARWPQVAAFLTGVGGQGITALLDGVRAKENELATAYADRLERALENARARVEGFQQRFSDAFSSLGEMARRAFDAQTSSLLDEIDRKFEAKIDKWESFAQALTPAEQALAKLDQTEAARARNAELRSAQEQLAQARAIEDVNERVAAVAAAEERLRQAELAITRAKLEEKAQVQRAKREEEAAAHIAALEEAKQREQTNLEERRRLLASKLDEQLQVLIGRLARHPEEWDKTQRAIVKLLKGYGADMKTAGENLGKAFARGIAAAEDEVRRAAEQLAKTVARYTQLKSPAEAGPLKELDHFWDAFAPTLLRGLRRNDDLITGTLAGTVSAPAAAGAGGGGLHLHVGTMIGSDLTQAAEEIRRALLRKRIANVNLGLG